MQNRRWKPIGTLPIGLQHLESETAAQRYMGYRAISILRCAAQNRLERDYRDADRITFLQKLAEVDDKQLFKDITTSNLMTLPYFYDPVTGQM